ncbi:MAG: RDD family protein [Pseudomonadota bacterium]
MYDTQDDWNLPDPDTQPEFYQDVPTKRLLAWLIDSAAIGVLTLILIPFTAFAALFFLPLFWLAIGLIYRIVTLAGGSATPGMRIMLLSIRSQDGQPLNGFTAAAHTIIYSVCMAFVLLQVVSIVLMLTTERRQGLPDLVLGTAALNRAGRH